MDYRRNYQSGGIYFFTIVTQNRQPILIDNIWRLRTAFRHARKRYPFGIDAVVVLPDHLHTIWHLPEGDHDYSRRWMVLKRKFSTGLCLGILTESQRRRGEKGIWQRRYWEHTIRDQADWRQHMDYIHYNPVKHGYVGSPGEWPYSSFGRSVQEGLYESNWGESLPEHIIGMDWE